jgi:hypothetical protein
VESFGIRFTEYISCETGKLIPHDKDCSKFIKCGVTDALNIELSCYPPTLYNTQTQNCDLPQNVQCQQFNILERPVDNSTEPSEDPLGFFSFRFFKFFLYFVFELLYFCLELIYCKPGCLEPHQTDCNKFYKCTHNDAIEYRCPSSMLFNPITKSFNFNLFI